MRMRVKKREPRDEETTHDPVVGAFESWVKRIFQLIGPFVFQYQQALANG